MQVDNCIEKLIMEGRSKISLTCVENVDGFSEEVLKLTVKGKKVQIIGEKIKISRFDKDNGNLSADGIFYRIIYSDEKKPLVKKLFK